MGIRARVTDAMKLAMKEKDTLGLSTLRLINAAIKDRDIAARGEGKGEGVSDDEILALLAKMVKQRRESAQVYEEGGRLELADKELEEIKTIEVFLPKQLTEEEVADAIEAAISKLGAESMRDMGRVIGMLKSQYAGQMDFGRVGPMVKDRLG
ncbi:MAG: GatB/YqeY domain-containing protein [Pseudomonadota bacterium]